MSPTPERASDLAIVARALDGDPAALAEVFAAIESDRGPSPRAWPGLALAASERVKRGASLDVPEAVQRALHRAAAHHLVLASRLEQAAEALDAAGVAWAPIKGMDLANRVGVYPAPEARPTGDLDLLVHRADLDAARDALAGAGWSPLVEGPKVDRYLREEGYAWQARGPDGGLLELHFRLWGSVAADVGDALLDAADAEGGGSRLRLRPEHAYVLAAVHLFLDPPPRDVIAWRDLCGLARAGTPAAAIVGAADDLDLQLPVALAAEVSRRLWDHPSDAAVVAALRPMLKPPELLILDHADAPDTASIGHLVTARSMAGRHMRHSLPRLVWRRLWAHPGVVEAAGVSRWTYQLAAWGLRPAEGRAE